MKKVEKQSFKEYLANVLSSMYAKNKFNCENFFIEWFIKNGKAYSFLFKKDITVTNLQYAELISLLKVHIKPEHSKSAQLQFVSKQEFYNDFGPILCDVQMKSKQKPKEIEKAIVNLYGNTLKQVVALELFKGSCTVFLPPHLELDLFAICSESGYIHSCGHNVYSEPLNKANTKDIFKKIEKHIKKHFSQHNRAYVSIYAHEDFTKYDREYASELDGGLQNLKIFVEKYYIGDKRFITFINELEKKFHNRITLQGPGDFRKEQERRENNKMLDKSRTIWFIIDQDINSDIRYLICYDQLYKNCNPFHIFDENKPAWISHTTIPHTMVGAMINLTRPWWSKSKVLVGDPFSGTGTIWLEFQKFKDISLFCSDISPISGLLSKDNKFFFTLKSSDLKDIKNKLERLKKSTNMLEEMNKKNPKENEEYKIPVDLYNEAIDLQKNEEIDIPKKIVQKLKKISFFSRLIFYLNLRTKIRHYGALKRESEKWDEAFIKELDILCWQIEELSILRDKQEKQTIKKYGKFTEFINTYSHGTTLNNLYFEHTSVVERNARVKIKRKLDVVITDPPYGFNTDEDLLDLARTYAESIKSIIASLRDNGQLVLCVPEKSYTGRQIGAFSRSGWLIQQIIAESRVLGYEPIIEAQVFPSPGQLFRSPYYWESVRALRRTILHFRFKKLKKSKKLE